MVFPQKIVLFRYVLIVKARNGLTGPLLGRVPWVPGTRKILSSYVLAPVNFYQITGKQLPSTRKILRPLICGTRGLKFPSRALHRHIWIHDARKDNIGVFYEFLLHNS